ncbi:MAG: radical SAM protein [Planctomycetaceae bacterium]|nr:radical SAM protein [Planctomycetaceae bacterium]
MPDSPSDRLGLSSEFVPSDREILTARGAKNTVDPYRPYLFFNEAEYSADGRIENTATVFLTNRECPFRCLMCDLWRNTTNHRVPVGAIPEQIRFALDRLMNDRSGTSSPSFDSVADGGEFAVPDFTGSPPAHIKLYNSGNFFDTQAIPPEDLPEIAELVSSFRTVVVECHPKLCTSRCAEFQQQCGIQLEVAMGLETSHEPSLRRLNKQMTTKDFADACHRLLRDGIRIRCFVLLRPPDTTEQQGVDRAIESLKFAFDCGVECCVVIPTRSGNGIMNLLQTAGRFEPPEPASLERVLDNCIPWRRGRVFADTWDLKEFARCRACAPARIQRLRRICLTQQLPGAVVCSVCSSRKIRL